MVISFLHSLMDSGLEILSLEGYSIRESFFVHYCLRVYLSMYDEKQKKNKKEKKRKEKKISACTCI